MSQYRIGIDVGGTFTHAVALDNSNYKLVGQVKVQTTHKSENGVADGIIESLKELLFSCQIKPEDVSFIAHSTTQATNALLEGDVCPVGVIASGEGLEGKKVRTDTNFKDIEISTGKKIKIFYRFVEKKDLNSEFIQKIIGDLKQEGASSIVAAAAFSVDDPTDEKIIIEEVLKSGLPATGTHEISGLYGLKTRTRTAIVNASILPKMLDTALSIQRCLKILNINASLLIMRSDGGAMKIDEVGKRPILTILSGPAAGIASALLYVKISNGIFVEVGGTSTDISVIRNGRALVNSAQIGGHKLFLRTLDSRTVGVAGGSLPRILNNSIVDVGPRSAHIVGLKYSVFSNADEIMDAKIEGIEPHSGDPKGYFSLSGRYAITPTCAANVLGLVDANDWAYGNRESAIVAIKTLLKENPGMGKNGKKVHFPQRGLSEPRAIPSDSTERFDKLTAPSEAEVLVEVLSRESRGASSAARKGNLFCHLDSNLSVEDDDNEKFKDEVLNIAENILKIASSKIISTINSLIKDYKLEKENITLIGGGGGASALVPFVSKEMGIDYKIAPNNAVISAIGCALALISDTIERTIIDPNDKDILDIREKVRQSVVKMGASFETIETFIEIDKQKNILRATASGTTELRKKDLLEKNLTIEERRKIAGEYLKTDEENLKLEASSDFYDIWSSVKQEKKYFGIFNKQKKQTIAMDKEGIVRFVKLNASVFESNISSAINMLDELLDKHVSYGDAGEKLPSVYILCKNKIIDLSTLASKDQIMSLAKVELENVARDDKIIIILG